jgi:TrpR-related protein YerC/YecD
MRIDKLSKEETRHFFDTILLLDDVDECYAFFDDLMTLKEMKVFVTRLTVAEMLLEGKTYQEIEKKNTSKYSDYFQSETFHRRGKRFL